MGAEGAKGFDKYRPTSGNFTRYLHNRLAPVSIASRGVGVVLFNVASKDAESESADLGYESSEG